MATSLIDFDVDPEQCSQAGAVQNQQLGSRQTIDRAIEHQLNELSLFKPSTESSSSTRPTSTCLLDLDEFIVDDKSELKGSFNSANGQLVSPENNVSYTVDKLISTFVNPKLASNGTLDKLVDNSLTKVSTENKELVIVYTNPISWMFEYASRKRLKNPFFVHSEIESGFKVTCTFVGVTGEATGRSRKIAKTLSAEDCLKNFNKAILVKESVDVDAFRKKPDLVDIKLKTNGKPSNAIGELYEHAAKLLNTRPRFETYEEKERGRKLYTVTCYYLSYCESSTNSNKQKAKMEAALQVYERLVNDHNAAATRD